MDDRTEKAAQLLFEASKLVEQAEALFTWDEIMDDLGTHYELCIDVTSAVEARLDNLIYGD